jgi:AraC-like DNA-binding protein
VRGNGTVVSVSRAVGYPSASHFINEFRRRFGLPPRAYCDLSTLRSQLGAQHTVNPT